MHSKFSCNLRYFIALLHLNGCNTYWLHYSYFVDMKRYIPVVSQVGRNERMKLLPASGWNAYDHAKMNWKCRRILRVNLTSHWQSASPGLLGDMLGSDLRMTPLPYLRQQNKQGPTSQLPAQWTLKELWFLVCRNAPTSLHFRHKILDKTLWINHLLRKKDVIRPQAIPQVMLIMSKTICRHNAMGTHHKCKTMVVIIQLQAIQVTSRHLPLPRMLNRRNQGLKMLFMPNSRNRHEWGWRSTGYTKTRVDNLEHSF